MEYTKVKDEPGFVRDINSRGILSVDTSGLLAYKKQKTARIKQTETINNLRDDVEVLKSDISEIKNLLVCLLDK